MHSVTQHTDHITAQAESPEQHHTAPRSVSHSIPLKVRGGRGRVARLLVMVMVLVMVLVMERWEKRKKRLK
jgi:hypothetical protein